MAFLTGDPFDPQALARSLAAPSRGAQVLFVGTVLFLYLLPQALSGDQVWNEAHQLFLAAMICFMVLASSI